MKRLSLLAVLVFVFLIAAPATFAQGPTEEKRTYPPYPRPTPSIAPAPPRRVVFESDKDTVIRSNVEIGAGDWPGMFVGQDYAWGTEYALIHTPFDIPADATVLEANLYVTARNCYYCIDLPVTAHPITRFWDESDTWNNNLEGLILGNSLGEPVSMTVLRCTACNAVAKFTKPDGNWKTFWFSSPTFIDQQFRWNITSIVRSWQNGSAWNNGVGLKSTVNDWYGLYSRESGQQFSPKIEVFYVRPFGKN